MSISVIVENCTGCGSCEAVCPFGAIEIVDDIAVIKDNCNLCGACPDACEFDAIVIERPVEEDAGEDDSSGVWVFAEQNNKPLPLASHFATVYKDDLKGLLERRYVRVLTTFNKTNFFLYDGKTFGFEYSLLKEYEKFLNKRIKRSDMKIVLEFIPVSRDQLIPKLINGQGDIAAAGLTITPRRVEVVNFTDPYLSNIDEIVVANKHVKGVNNLEDLSGRRVFVRESSSYYSSFLSLNKRFSQKGIPPVQIVKVDENLETEDILELVNSGAIGITVSDSHIATIWSQIFKDLQMLGHMKVRTGSRIAWMVRKNNLDLKESLEGILLRKVDILEMQAVKNPYLKKSIDSNKLLIYGSESPEMAL